MLGSCTEQVNIDLDSSYTRLVVDGQITTDTTRHYVRLSKTMDYFSNRPADPVTGGRVMINNHLLTESDTAPGLYLTDPGFYGETGETYTLSIQGIDIDSDGSEEIYEATSRINSIARADSIEVVYQEYAGGAVQLWGIQLYAKDPVERNYYLFKVLKNDTLVTDTIDEYVIQDDRMFNGNYVPGVMVQSLIKAKKDEIIRPGDVITLEANGITQDYYKYIIELTNEVGPSNPLFSGPRANVRTNIEGGNGAAGFFRAYSINRISVVVEDPYEKILKW